MRLTPPRAVAVVLASAADLPFVVALQKRNGDILGFIPRAGLREKVGLGQVWLAREGGAPVGYLHHGSLGRPEVRIFQAAVVPAARRRGVARALVEDLAGRAARAGARGLSLRCRDGLTANAFWRAAGFMLAAVEPGARGALNVWVRRLGPEAIKANPIICGTAPAAGLVFHSRLHPCPACGRPTTDTWTRGAIRRRLCAWCVRRGRDDRTVPGSSGAF